MGCTTNDDCVAPLSCIDGSCTVGDCSRVSYPNPRTDPVHFCCWDALDRNALNCDERAYIGPDDDIGNGDGNIRIGSFAAAMVLQTAECPTACAEPAARMRAGDNAAADSRVRGNTSLTFVDIGAGTPETPPTLTCSSEVEDFATCDEDHRVNKAGSALAAPSPEATPPEVRAARRALRARARRHQRVCSTSVT